MFCNLKRYVNQWIYSEFIFSRIGNGFSIQDEFRYKISDDETDIYKLVNIQYYTSEDYLSRNFKTVIYNFHTYVWWYIYGEINYVSVPKDIYSLLPTEKSFNEKSIAKKNICKDSQYMCGFIHVLKENFNHYVYIY